VDLSAQPYIWWRKDVLGFEITPKPVSANPWDAAVAAAVAPGNYDITRFVDNIWQPRPELNIVFINDVRPELRAHPAFFPDKAVGQSWKIGATYELLLKENAALDQVWKAGEGAVPKVNYSRVTFIGELNKSGGIDLAELCRSLKPTMDVPFGQFIFDDIKIQYKISKKRRRPMSRAMFDQFTAFDRLPKIQGVVALIPMKYHDINQQAYARVVLEVAGKLIVQYKIDHNINVTLQDFDTVNGIILNWLRVSVPLRISSLSARTMINASGGIDAMRSSLSKMLQVFHIEKFKHGTVNSIEVVYKRSVNYKSDLDVVDNIISQVNNGIPLQDIKENLVNNMGMTGEEVQEWIAQYNAYVETQQQAMQNGEKPKSSKKKNLSTGCIFRITTAFKLGFNVHFENLGSVNELHNAIRWLKGVAASLPAVTTKKATTAAAAAAAAAAATPVSSSSSSMTPPPPASATMSPRSIAASSFSFGSDSSSGGAAGKHLNGYFLSRLTERDKVLFTPGPKEKAYPTLCSVTNARQPVVVTPEEMETIRQKGYTSGIPDSTEYRGNHYFCPLLWCPREGIPVTPEQLIDVNGAKVCPGSYGEDPIDLRDPYFLKGNKYEKHISFINSKWKAGLCLPCCAKKVWVGNPQFEEKIRQCKAGPVQRVSVSKPDPGSRPPSGPSGSRPPSGPSGSRPPSGPQGSRPPSGPQGSSSTSVSAAAQVDQTNFIKKAAAPIPIGRVGTIPEDLHNIMIPDMPYDKCSTTLTTTPCLVRIGIDHGDDSIMNAVAKSLQKDKAALIGLIKKRLDPLTFISLDNGNTVQTYLPISDSPVNESERKQAQQWLERYPSVAALFGEGHVSARSRLAVIYRSYLNFITFLTSNGPKSVPLVIELLAACLNTTLLVFEKTGGDAADVYCPRNARSTENIIIVLREEHYFEPLILKARNRDYKSVFSTGDFEGLATLFENSCDMSYRELIGAFRGLKQWVDNRLVAIGYLAFHTVIIRPDLAIHGFMTRGNVVIISERGLPLSILPELVLIFGIKNVAFLEDLQAPHSGTPAAQELPESDLRMLGQKLESMAMKIVSNESLSGAAMYHSYYPAIHVSSVPGIREQDRRWHHVQSAVLKIIIEHYNTLVEPLNARPPKEQRDVLVRTFRGLVNPGTPGAADREAVVYHVLEQMPLREGLTAILRWKRMGYEDPLWTSAGIYDKNGYWEFTQFAVEEGIPGYVMPFDQDAQTGDDRKQPEYVPTKQTGGPAPPTFIADSNLKPLPSKWQQGSFTEFKILNNAYKHDSITKLTEWLSTRTLVPVSWHDVRHVTEIQLIKRLSRTETHGTLLTDVSVLHFLRTRLNPLKQLKNAAEVRATLEAVTQDKLVGLFSSSAAALWPCDIHLAVIAKLLDISIFLIGRAAYKSSAQEQRTRGQLNDRIVSSALFVGSKGWRDKPIIFMFKASAAANAEHTVYHAVRPNTGTFLQPSYHQLADDVKKVIDAVHAAST
jgi:hypothetical protein